MLVIQHTLSGGRGRRICIHHSWRGKHNVGSGRGRVRITIRVRGRRIIPCVSSWRRRIRRARKWLRILWKCGRMGCLFSTGGSGLCLVAAHVVGSGEQKLYCNDTSRGGCLSRSSNYTLGARLVQQESGKVAEKKTGSLGSGSFGISRSRRRSDLARWCSASISA